MAGAPRVQLSLKGRLLSEVPFTGDALRVGRMRENDVVVNNLAVSRFHATIHRQGDGYVLEDLGSENDTQLNGARITGKVPVQAGDVIRLGKYELRIVTQAGAPVAAAPNKKPSEKKPSDAWDASQTFFDPALAGKPVAAPPAAAKSAPPAPSIDVAPADLVAEEAPRASSPDPDGVFAFGEDDLSPASPGDSKLGAREMLTDPLATASPEHTSLFDFGSEAPLAGASAEAAPARAAAPSAATGAGDLHAGLIVQREGKLHELRSWDSEQLVAGRAPECEVMLADAGISRRHAAFVRSGKTYEVRDLDSVNGVYVNGQRTKRQVLAVGDVVRIESFELTFVLDHQPIGSEVSAPAPALAGAQEAGRATQFSMGAAPAEEEPFELAPLAGDPAEAPLSGGAEPAPLPEADLVVGAGADEPDEKDLTAEISFMPAASAANHSAAALAPSAPIEVKIALDGSKLPTRLRQALALLGAEGLQLPATLTIKLSDPGE